MMPASQLARRWVLAALGASVLIAKAHADAAPDAADLIRPGDPLLGNPHGDLTIVDFYDIRCPPCRAMDGKIARLLKQDQNIRYVPVDYPILGAASALGAQALLAAQIQGQYEPLRRRLLSEAVPPTDASIEADAAALRLNWDQMQLDMNGDAVAHRIAANIARGQALQLSGIPALFIGSIFVPGELSDQDFLDVVAMARARHRVQTGPPA